MNSMSMEKNECNLFISMNTFTLASNVSSCAILGFSFVVVIVVDDDDGADNIVCKIMNRFAELK